MIEVSEKGIKDFFGAVKKLEREHRKVIAKVFREKLKGGVAQGRALIGQLFHGRGKRIKRAFRHSVKLTSDDVIGRMGYLSSKAKGNFWWLGRIYEQGGIKRIRSKKRSAKGGKLWVPIGENRAGSGAPIVTPRQFFSQFQGRSVVKKSSRGNLLAFKVEDEELVPMFVLKDEIPFQSRPAVGPTAKKVLPELTQGASEEIFAFFGGKRI